LNCLPVCLNENPIQSYKHSTTDYYGFHDNSSYIN